MNNEENNTMTAEKLVELSRLIAMSPLPDEKKDEFVNYMANASMEDLLNLYNLVVEASESEDKLNSMAKKLADKVIDVQQKIESEHQAEADRQVDIYSDDNQALPD
jgi:7,8-dihydro-6-hydroxymethylpterin-pyrophosphokinase